MELEFNSYSKYGRNFASGQFYVVAPVKASSDWQTVEIDIKDLKPLQRAGGIPTDWQTLDHLTITHNLNVMSDGKKQTFKSNAKHGQGRKIRNLQWVGGKYPATILMNGGGLELSLDEYEKQFSNQIDVSIDLEEKVDGLDKAK